MIGLAVAFVLVAVVAFVAGCAVICSMKDFALIDEARDGTLYVIHQDVRYRLERDRIWP